MHLKFQDDAVVHEHPCLNVVTCRNDSNSKSPYVIRHPWSGQSLSLGLHLSHFTPFDSLLNQKMKLVPSS